MVKIIRVALEDINADTNNNPENFSLFTQEGGDEHILIKEKQRSEVIVGAGGVTNITHGLGYVPFVLVFVSQGSGRWKKAYGFSIESINTPYYTINGSQLTLINPFGSGGAKTFRYYMFYDKVI